MLMHALTYKYHKALDGVLVAESPVHIGKMIETLNELSNGKETSLLS